jgi:hypothetical protein
VSSIRSPLTNIWDDQTAKSVGASYDALVEIFECVENFLLRLRIYTEIKEPADAMTEVVIKIMAELISVLALATKQIKLGRFSTFILDDHQAPT